MILKAEVIFTETNFAYYMCLNEDGNNCEWPSVHLHECTVLFSISICLSLACMLVCMCSVQPPARHKASSTASCSVCGTARRNQRATPAGTSQGLPSWRCARGCHVPSVSSPCICAGAAVALASYLLVLSFQNSTQVGYLYKMLWFKTVLTGSHVAEQNPEIRPVPVYQHLRQLCYDPCHNWNIQYIWR